MKANYIKKQNINLLYEFVWSCCKTRYDGDNCGGMEGGMEHEIHYEENDKIIIEYRDINNKYIADVAIINDNKVKYIFEIKHTHSTTTNVRPEPWFEITTQQIFEEDINNKKDITLTCIRNNKNRYCSNCRILDEEIICHDFIIKMEWKQNGHKNLPALNAVEQHTVQYL
jgi:hypothetical protein